MEEQDTIWQCRIGCDRIGYDKIRQISGRRTSLACRTTSPSHLLLFLHTLSQDHVTAFEPDPDTCVANKNLSEEDNIISGDGDDILDPSPHLT
jgi:hypothetical protein